MKLMCCTRLAKVFLSKSYSEAMTFLNGSNPLSPQDVHIEAKTTQQVAEETSAKLYGHHGVSVKTAKSQNTSNSLIIAKTKKRQRKYK